MKVKHKTKTWHAQIKTHVVLSRNESKLWAKNNRPDNSGDILECECDRKCE